MITIIFNRNKLTCELTQYGARIVHAYPACKAIKQQGVDEYYLEGYGTQAEDLQKITMEEIVSTMKNAKRMDLL